MLKTRHRVAPQRLSMCDTSLYGKQLTISRELGAFCIIRCDLCTPISLQLPCINDLLRRFGVKDSSKSSCERVESHFHITHECQAFTDIILFILSFAIVELNLLYATDALSTDQGQELKEALRSIIANTNEFIMPNN